MIGINRMYNEDCLVGMDRMIEAGIVVDAIICDPPYGTTACAWDSIIPFDAMWLRLNKLIKQNGAIVLFGSEPFSSALRMSNIKNYKYDIVWEKEQATNFQQLNKQFGKSHENISIFYKKQPTYNPQMVQNKKPSKSGSKNKVAHNNTNGGSPKREGVTDRYPCSIHKFNRDRTGHHPTQKPVALMEYLIKTYTNEGELVLDFTIGSGTTAVAAKQTNRNFIGFELDKNYFDIANKRLESVQGSLL